MKARTLLQGAGAAALVMFPIYGAVINSSGAVRMHTPAPLTMFAFSLIANLLLVSLVSAIAGFWLKSRPQTEWLKVLFTGIVLASFAEAVSINLRGSQSVHFWLLAWIAVTASAVVLHFVWQRGERLLFQASSATLIGLGFYCMFVILQLLHLAMWRPLPHSTMEMPAARSSAVSSPRVVWILLDELSYDQIFEHRYPGLELPNFDAFRKSSTLFTHTEPASNSTEKAIPGILLGQQIERVNYTFSNHLEVATAKGKLQLFQSSRTPFAIAQKHGLTTGVTGWYNPYCSLLAPYLNTCYWTYEALTPAIFALGDGFWQDLLDPWVRYTMVFHHSKQQRALASRVGIYQDLLHHADSMLQPSGPDFVFIHLPAPHPPGFYDRRTQRYDISGNRSYIDNLSLADRTLGQLLTVLQQSPRWKETSVVLCGDHSWRAHSWKYSRYWTAEDRAASHGGVFDQRPLVMVHLAGQTTGATVDSAFPLLQLHGVLDDLVQGKRPTYGPASPSK